MNEETSGRILLIGDLHLSHKTELEFNMAISSLINDILMYETYDFCVILGDLLDRCADAKDINIGGKMIRVLSKLAEMFPVFIIPGNHDFEENFQGISWLEEYNSWMRHPNIHNFYNGGVFHWKSMRYTFVPYTPIGSFVHYLNEIDPLWRTSNVIFAHQEFKGAAMLDEYSWNGDDWHITFPVCISGHIHRFQQLQTNLLYTGSFFETLENNCRKYLIEVYIKKCNDKAVIEYNQLTLPNAIRYFNYVN